MITYDYKGFEIRIISKILTYEEEDLYSRVKTRFERETTARLRFGRFTIWSTRMNDLIFLKASLNCFLREYWQRSKREGGRINFEKSIHHGSPEDDFHYSLHFVARQKNKENFLHIYFQDRKTTAKEIFLDGHEVTMLDIAIGKTISLINPTAYGPEDGRYVEY